MCDHYIATWCHTVPLSTVLPEAPHKSKAVGLISALRASLLITEGCVWPQCPSLENSCHIRPMGDLFNEVCILVLLGGLHLSFLFCEIGILLL